MMSVCVCVRARACVCACVCVCVCVRASSSFIVILSMRASSLCCLRSPLFWRPFVLLFLTTLVSCLHQTSSTAGSSSDEVEFDAWVPHGLLLSFTLSLALSAFRQLLAAVQIFSESRASRDELAPEDTTREAQEVRRSPAHCHVEVVCLWTYYSRLKRFEYSGRNRRDWRQTGNGSCSKSTAPVQW